MKHNGGIPDKQVFDHPRKGMVFANLLSFNHEDEETVYKALVHFLVGNELTAIPFAGTITIDSYRNSAYNNAK